MLETLITNSFEELTLSTPISVGDGSLLEAIDFGITDEYLNKTLTNNRNKDEKINLFCIWFESNINANFIIDSKMTLIDPILNINSSSIQTGMFDILFIINNYYI